MRAGVPIIAVFPQRPNRPLQKIFREHGKSRRMPPWNLRLGASNASDKQSCAARIGCNTLDIATLPAASQDNQLMPSRLTA
jgi:hypothetical protein